MPVNYKDSAPLRRFWGHSKHQSKLDIDEYSATPSSGVHRTSLFPCRIERFTCSNRRLYR